jgi:hypothetical protein
MTGLEGRATMEAAVRRELFGPVDEMPRGKPLMCAGGSARFDSKETARGLWHDSETGQEILTESDPLRRYGIGVLYNGAADAGDLTWVPGLPDSDETSDAPVTPAPAALRQDEPDSDDFDLTDANAFKPRAMAVSFKCRIAKPGSFSLMITGAYYDRLAVHVGGYSKPWEWWVRRPFVLRGVVPGELVANRTRTLLEIPTESTATLRVKPNALVFSRPVPGESDPQLRLVTVAVINAAPGSGPSAALFQMSFEVQPQGDVTIEPYPDIEQPDGDEEEQSIDLLYRNKRTFAIGHGCAGDWSDPVAGTTPAVRATPMPAYEVPSLTPNVYIAESDGNRRPVLVSMRALADDTAEGRAQVETVLSLYDSWIAEREAEIDALIERFRPAATRHIALCRDALARMRAGWQMIADNPLAARAFRLANEAMLYQQVRSRLELRPVEHKSNGTNRVIGAHPVAEPGVGTGLWRPFQIAFILASLPELVDRTAPHRELVDLIFFPTGGGKTEAYLGACAVSLVARRLCDPADVGTDTLMRYTLRLLTAQQFLRAAALICVLEDIRSKQPDLGEVPFGIGIWLGGTSTPNTWKQAVDVLGELRRKNDAQNKFLLLRCPWCGAQMGPIPKGRSGQEVIGYEQAGKKVVFRCADNACRFGGRATLPVHVVDDDIYATRPSLVIGTVDKFAMMAWRPLARRLFGLGEDGSRELSPPGLIIQDELHLISGPLGSMVGLYEPIIEDLCTDTRSGTTIRPKIIASTATIRRFEDQIRCLYGREQVALFPPRGLEEGHSFFAEPATLDDGTPAPGRRYLAIMSASLGSMQTVQVRVAAATLQAGMEIPEADRDGYWTNLNFLNSLRELGNTVSLLQSDIPDYLTGLRRREQLGTDPRWPRTPLELTSRRRSDEIPKAIEQLQLSYGKPGCVDICLASNIIEVGVDIDRLGLMTIVGQPKTTAQYIQVSGRVGRKPEISPGLVITVYGAAKPRDRSHYERFRSYHQRLYAQVEPTSVTPFAVPVLRRAMHAAAIAHIRQVGPDLEPYPFPENEYNVAIDLLRRRAALADAEEMPALERMQRQRAGQWRNWDRTQWSGNALGGDPQQGLMRFAGTLPELSSRVPMWDVPTSMRNVDAECRLEVSLAYNQQDALDAEAGS